MIERADVVGLGERYVVAVDEQVLPYDAMRWSQALRRAQALVADAVSCGQVLHVVVIEATTWTQAASFACSEGRVVVDAVPGWLD